MATGPPGGGLGGLRRVDRRRSALVFAGVALVAAQVSESARAAGGIAGAVLGAAYVAARDRRRRRRDRVLALPDRLGAGHAAVRGRALVAAAAVRRGDGGAGGVALVLLARRDRAPGSCAPRPGRAASPRRALRRPLGLALRLQRGTLLGWGAGLLALGAAYGSFARDVGDLLDTSAQVEDFFSRAGGASIIDSYLATVISILALLGTGFTIQSVLRLRGEETAGRAEPVLAAPLARARWALSHIAVAVAGTTVLLALGGAAMGLADAVRGAGLEQVPRLAGAALVQAPAAWVLGGAGAALLRALAAAHRAGLGAARLVRGRGPARPAVRAARRPGRRVPVRARAVGAGRHGHGRAAAGADRRGGRRGRARPRRLPPPRPRALKRRRVGSRVGRRSAQFRFCVNMCEESELGGRAGVRPAPLPSRC